MPIRLADLWAMLTGFKVLSFHYDRRQTLLRCGRKEKACYEHVDNLYAVTVFTVEFRGAKMWYFIVGAALGVVSLIAKNPIAFFQSNHPIQGAVFVAVVGAAIYGTILWVIGNFVY